jgi:hypothetical protein
MKVSLDFLLPGQNKGCKLCDKARRALKARASREGKVLDAYAFKTLQCRGVTMHEGDPADYKGISEIIFWQICNTAGARIEATFGIHVLPSCNM